MRQLGQPWIQPGRRISGASLPDSSASPPTSPPCPFGKPLTAGRTHGRPPNAVVPDPAIDFPQESATEHQAGIITGNHEILPWDINNGRALQTTVWAICTTQKDMDLSVLPNNNHPDKFLQLEVKSLIKKSALPPASLPILSGGNYPTAQHWHNLVYSQREKRNAAEQVGGKLSVKDPMIINCILGEQSTSTFKLKNNPLYGDIRLEEAMEERKQSPSWTIQDYEKHSLQPNLSGYLKENPNDLRFWLGDTYTPGYDALLKKKEQQWKQSKYCRISLIMLVTVCILVSIITVCNFLT